MSSSSRSSQGSAATTLSATARDRLDRLQTVKAERRREEAVARSRKREIPLVDFVKRSFPNKYQAGWVHELVCRKLEEFSAAVARGESPRLMLFLPPRHGKSFISSERFPVWHLGHYPAHNVVVASHSQSLSNKFSRRARGVATSDLAREIFPDFALADDRRAASEWEATEGGGLKAVGIGAGITGSGADVLIIDDVVKDHVQADSKAHRENCWEWYSSTGYTRLAPGGGVLIILTRWHEDDLAGRILKQAENDPEADQWEVIRFPAIAEENEWLMPSGEIATGDNVVDFLKAKAKLLRKRGDALHEARFNAPRLSKIRRSIISRHWSALYQQRPTSAEGTLFKRSWWQYYTKAPAKFDRLIQSWDFTFDDTDGSDYVIGQVWGVRGGEFYLLDQVRDRMDAPTAVRAVVAMTMKWPKAKAKLVEKKANGAAIMKLLKRKLSGFIPFEPHGSKEARAAAVSPDVESGNVYLPEDAPWVHDFVEELAAFPKGANDDQVDALTQALIYLSGYATARDKLNALIGRKNA